MFSHVYPLWMQRMAKITGGARLGITCGNYNNHGMNSLTYDNSLGVNVKVL